MGIKKKKRPRENWRINTTKMYYLDVEKRRVPGPELVFQHPGQVTPFSRFSLLYLHFVISETIYNNSNQAGENTGVTSCVRIKDMKISTRKWHFCKWLLLQQAGGVCGCGKTRNIFLLSIQANCLDGTVVGWKRGLWCGEKVFWERIQEGLGSGFLKEDCWWEMVGGELVNLHTARHI